MWIRVLLVAFILFCFELGLFLVVLPWSDVWERNLLVTLFPGLRVLTVSNYFRGAVTGLGMLNLWVGLSDLWNFRKTIERLDQAERAEEHATLAGNAGLPPTDPPQ